MDKKTLVTIGKNFTPQAKEILEKIGSVDCLDLTQAELIEAIKDYEIVLVGLGLNINKEIINKAINLKIIATATTGLDHINVEYAKEKGIEILSLQSENDFLNTITGTAELAFGLIIDLLRQTQVATSSVKNYQWDRENFRGHNLYKQILGIVGLGRLGKWVARYGNAFGMKVIAYDPEISEEDFKQNNCQQVSFEELIEQSDIISIHVHLNADTENMFNKNIFDQMKNNAYLINTARGKIANESDLLDALKNKKIAGYATDVLADELNFDKNFSSHPLIEYAKENNNLIITPHIGGMTHESREATDIFMAGKIIKFK